MMYFLFMIFSVGFALLQYKLNFVPAMNRKLFHGIALAIRLGVLGYLWLSLGELSGLHWIDTVIGLSSVWTFGYLGYDASINVFIGTDPLEWGGNRETLTSWWDKTLAGWMSTKRPIYMVAAIWTVVGFYLAFM